MYTKYAIYRIKQYGLDNPRLNKDNCIGYGDPCGEEFVVFRDSKEDAKSWIRNEDSGMYLIKKIYVNE